MTSKDSKNIIVLSVVVTILIIVFVGGLLNSQIISRSENTSSATQQPDIENLRKELEALKQKEEADRQVDGAKSSNIDLASIVSEWRNRTAFLMCSGNTPSGQSYIQTATAYIHRFADGEVSAITNKHAVTDSYGNVVSSCEITIPTDLHSILVSSQNINLHPDPTIDASRIFLDNTDSFLSSIVKKKVCFQQPDVEVKVGDQVVLLGYPAIGSPTDITATEGIISGYDYPYYVTSAKIDHGNSGGLAILVKGDCYLGIPTRATVGSVESLGRILEAKIIQSTAQNK
jgi:hypothetical protein